MPKDKPGKSTENGPGALKALGFNSAVATGVLALFIGLGALFRDWVTPFLADSVFGLTDHVIERVMDSREIVESISAAVRDETLAGVHAKIDAGYSISVAFFPLDADEGAFDRHAETRLVAFHAKPGQLVCIAQQPVFNGVTGKIDIKVDGRPWREVTGFEDFNLPTDVTKLVSFEGGFRGVHIHEVQLVPALAVDEHFARLAAARGGRQLRPSAFLKLVILVYKGDRQRCVE